IVLDNPRFFARERKKNKWRIIVAIDESGSMMESIIYSAVIASIFASLPSIKTNLVIFDTEVVDLTEEVGDPVDILMKVTLGGGTDITKCLKYVRSLITNPRRTLIILITDFYEGNSYHNLDEQIIHIKESGAHLLGIGALSRSARPVFNRDYARKLNKMGIDVIACTPEKLAPIVAKIIES
ncbi:MAG: VWA domain-containing protein, partial [Candidatus Hodarchaeota archaeon]